MDILRWEREGEEREEKKEMFYQQKLVYAT